MNGLNHNINSARPKPGVAVVSAALNTWEDVAKLTNLVKDVISSVTKESKTLSQFLNLSVLSGFAYVTINE